MSWTAEKQASDDVHVYPSDDLAAHHLVPDCACDPLCEPVRRGDGTSGCVYTHRLRELQRPA